MQKKIISQRLERVGAFVPQGARLLDVGSDHAYLPIYLMQQGRIEAAIAGEVVEGPFQSASKNVTAQGLDQQIEVRLADGLAAFEPTDQIDAIVIAGMGGRLIADILAGGQEKLASVQCLILQPNNREDELRGWLAENGFAIQTEDLLEEAGKFYEIIVAGAGQQVLTDQEKRFGPFLLQDQSPVFKAKWQKELQKHEKSLAKIPEKNQLERSAMSQKIEKIKEVLHAGE